MPSNSNLSTECLGCQTRSDSLQSSSAIGGSVAVPDIFVGFKKPSLSVDRGHSLSSLHLPQAALASLPHGNDTCSSNSNLSFCLSNIFVGTPLPGCPKKPVIFKGDGHPRTGVPTGMRYTNSSINWNLTGRVAERSESSNIYACRGKHT